MPVVILRSLIGRLGTVAVGLACLYVTAIVWLSDGYGNGMRVLSLALALITSAWLLWWRPTATLDAQGLRVRNAWRSHLLPWPGLAVVRTRWGLVLESARGRVSVSACQRGGLLSAMRHERQAPRAREEYLTPPRPGQSPPVYRTHLDADDAAYLIGLYAAALAEHHPEDGGGQGAQHQGPAQPRGPEGPRAQGDQGTGRPLELRGVAPEQSSRWDPAPAVVATAAALAVVGCFAFL